MGFRSVLSMGGEKPVARSASCNRKSRRGVVEVRRIFARKRPRFFRDRAASVPFLRLVYAFHPLFRRSRFRRHERPRHPWLLVEKPPHPHRSPPFSELVPHARRPRLLGRRHPLARSPDRPAGCRRRPPARCQTRVGRRRCLGRGLCARQRCGPPRLPHPRLSRRPHAARPPAPRQHPRRPRAHLRRHGYPERLLQLLAATRGNRRVLPRPHRSRHTLSLFTRLLQFPPLGSDGKRADDCEHQPAPRRPFHRLVGRRTETFPSAAPMVLKADSLRHAPRQSEKLS